MQAMKVETEAGAMEEENGEEREDESEHISGRDKQDDEIPLLLLEGMSSEDLEFDQVGNPFFRSQCDMCEQFEREESSLAEDADDSDYAPLGPSL